jgi:predicted XRE-type DNA-binding protein
MSYMSNLDYEINELLDTTRMSCEEIATALQCPVQLVNDVVEQRWNERVSAA